MLIGKRELQSLAYVFKEESESLFEDNKWMKSLIVVKVIRLFLKSF